jgi:hypothetical protein
MFRLQDRVCNDKFFNARTTNTFNSGSREDRMDTARLDTAGARVLEGLRGLGQCAGGIDHVINNDAVPTPDVTNNVHYVGDIRGRATLVDDSQAGVQSPCEGAGTVHAAGVRRNDHRVINGVIKGANILLKYGHCKHVVNRDVEKALNLARMQLERCFIPTSRRVGEMEKVGKSVSQCSRCGGWSTAG